MRIPSVLPYEQQSTRPHLPSCLQTAGVMAFLFALGLTNAFCAKTQQPASQVTVNVQGGSTIVGKCLDDPLNCYSSTLGIIRIPVANIASLAFPTNGNSSTAFLTATNSYTGNVQLLHRNLRVQTPFGKLELPVKMMLNLAVAIDYPSLTNNLLSFWNFNGTNANFYAPDGGSVSFPLQTGNDGVGAVNPGSVVSGKIGSAIGFADTGNQGLFIPAGQFPILTTFTVTAWVKLNAGGSPSANGLSLIACSWDGNGGRDFIMQIGSGQLQGSVGIGGFNENTQPDLTDNHISFYDYQWHFCVFQCLDRHYIRAKVDNNAWTTVPLSGSLAGAAPRPFQVGQNIAQSYFNANCTIDMLGVWDRVLSESELTGLYNNGNGLGFPFTAP